MKYDLFTFALKSLFCEAIEEGPAVITEGKLHVVVNFKPVRNIDLEPCPFGILLSFSWKSRTHSDDHLMTSFVNHTTTHLTLVTLLTQAPEMVSLSLQCFIVLFIFEMITSLRQ